MTATSTFDSSSVIKLEATRLSFAEVVCPLHEVIVRSKRNVQQTAKRTFIARGYDVSVSNDGVHFSVADSIVVFDSKCVNCTKVGKNIFCVKDPAFCMWNNHCFGINETADCEVCKPIDDGEVAWIGDPECLTTTKMTTYTSSQDHQTFRITAISSTQEQSNMKHKTIVSAQEHPTIKHKTTTSVQESLTPRLTTAETKTPTPQDKERNRLVGAIIGCATFGLIVTMILACFVFKRKRNDVVKNNAKTRSQKDDKDWASGEYTKEMDTFEPKPKAYRTRKEGHSWILEPI